jgi:hypothetical protein
MSHFSYVFVNGNVYKTLLSCLLYCGVIFLSLKSIDQDEVKYPKMVLQFYIQYKRKVNDGNWIVVTFLK